VVEEDLAVYFIKECVRQPLKFTSFHMAVSLTRILHSYGTRDAMNMYSTVAPNRSIQKDDDQCRTWKKRLMKPLEERFRGFVEVSRTDNGERRFKTTQDPQADFPLATRCLSRLTPTHTAHVLKQPIARFGPSPLDYSGPADGEHPVEINRFHTLICPHCFDVLTRIWTLPNSADRLSLPKFNVKGDPGMNSHDRFAPPTLTDESVGRALAEVEEEEKRRRTLSPHSLCVEVDGRSAANVDALGEISLCFDVEEDAEVVEIVDKTSRLLLVRHLLSYDSQGDLVTGTFEYTVGGKILAIEASTRENLASIVVKVHDSLTVVPQMTPSSSSLVPQIDAAIEVEGSIHGTFLAKADRTRLPLDTAPYVYLNHERAARFHKVVFALCLLASSWLIPVSSWVRPSLWPSILTLTVCLGIVQMFAVFQSWTYSWSSRLSLRYTYARGAVDFLIGRSTKPPDWSLPLRPKIALAVGIGLTILGPVLIAIRHYAETHFHQPAAVAVLWDQTIIADGGSNIIGTLSTNTNSRYVFNPMFRVSAPTALAVDTAGIVWVGNRDGSIYRYDAEGNLTEVAVVDGGPTRRISFEGGISGLAVALDGSAVYVTSSNSGVVYRLTIRNYFYEAQGNRVSTSAVESEPSAIWSLGDQEATYRVGSSRLSEPSTVQTYTYDANGRATVGSCLASQRGCQEDRSLISPEPASRPYSWIGGTEVRKAVVVGATALIPMSSDGWAPSGIAYSPDGRLFVADTANNRILEYTEQRQEWRTLLMAHEYAHMSSLNRPQGLTVDSLGNLYIADSGNSRIVRLRYSDNSEELDGQAMSSWSSFAVAGVSCPHALSLGSRGQLVVLDGCSSTIAVVNPQSGQLVQRVSRGEEVPTTRPDCQPSSVLATYTLARTIQSCQLARPQPVQASTRSWKPKTPDINSRPKQRRHFGSRPLRRLSSRLRYG
jgi:DNA-binding beta-propeller fold protein YncE